MLCCVGNHKKMLLATGYKADNIKEYRYFDNATKSLDLNGMQDDLEVIIIFLMTYFVLKILPEQVVSQFAGSIAQPIKLDVLHTFVLVEIHVN